MKNKLLMLYDKSWLITLGISTLIIGTAFLLPVFTEYHMSGGQYTWLIIMVVLGYAGPIIRTTMSDQLFSYKQHINEVYMMIILIICPAIMIFALVLIIIGFANLSPYIHINLFLFSFAGFYMHSYQHKEEMKDDYQSMKHSINQLRDESTRF